MKHGQGNWPNSRPGWDRMEPDFPAWLDNLEAEGIQLLVVTRVNPAEGAHNVAGPDFSRSNADGPMVTRNCSSHSMASVKTTLGFGCIECGVGNRSDRPARMGGTGCRGQMLSA